MKIKVQKTYGSAQIEVELEATKLDEALLQASVFTCKDVCFKCKSEDVSMEGRKVTGGFIYISRKCNKCAHTSTLGQYKDGAGFFWKQWEEPFQGNKPGTATTFEEGKAQMMSAPMTRKTDEVSPADLPF